MRPRLLRTLLILAAPTALASGTGEIVGTVKVVASPITSRVAGPQEAIIYLEDAPNVGVMPPGPFRMAQSGKDFTPGVLIVPLGATVDFPNEDAFAHNVFSVTPGDTFDLGLYKSGDVMSARMEHPGLVQVYCNIHPQMIGYILVVSSPFFTHARPDGSFELKGVPAGTYQAVAWFPFGQPTHQEVRVEPGGRATPTLIVRERSEAGRHKRKDGTPYVSYGPAKSP